MKTLFHLQICICINIALFFLPSEQTCCNSIDENNSPFVIKPNPGNGLYRIRSTDAHMNRFRLVDVSGKLLMDNRFAPCLESEIDIRHLPPGLYPLQIYGKDASYTQKLLKLT